MVMVLLQMLQTLLSHCLWAVAAAPTKLSLCQPLLGALGTCESLLHWDWTWSQKIG